ncbi:hypothetical protein NE237_028856 [Protea cynaroides]|uniref:Terpene synthase metal-binding domain-containing protein n=1 Tax=Protea cynaroides TaxID=273540 RepID=A0A9Q0JT97_9MAGN|nr:hypothetical protein NE237_028856 [Protea cynaroides]
MDFSTWSPVWLFLVCLYDDKMSVTDDASFYHIYVRWWREMGLLQELKFARNQPFKWYLWSLIALPDPKHSQRIKLTKPISLVYIIDDIFDVNGTLDELIHFTSHRLSHCIFYVPPIEELPEYMKICFKALDNITNEISKEVLKEHGWNPISIPQKVWASLCDAFIIEAKWFASKWHGVISSGVPLILTRLFFLLGQSLTKESIYCLEHNSAHDEDQEGHDGLYIACYMKEHGVYSIESPQDHIFCMILDSWKQLNRECLSKDLFSPIFKRASLNVEMMVPLMYIVTKTTKTFLPSRTISTQCFKKMFLSK